MRYKQGSFGRVFIIKFDDKDDLLSGIKTVALKENIRIGTVMLLGGLRSADMVTGPREAVIPPDPLWQNLADGREVVGIGTLFRDRDEPILHLHGAVGREHETLTGCIRKNASVYLVIEAIIAEVIGINAHKVLDDTTGVKMLEFP
jgi:predicted DNA-binding protein with PD1-like motif